MPNICRQPSVITKQIGIASETISVDGQSRRKKNSTKTDSSVPSSPAWPSWRQAFLHRLRLIAERVNLDALEFGFLANALDFRHHRFADFDEIRAAFLRNVDRDRRTLIQMARIREPARFHVDVGDVGKLQPLVVDGQRTNFLDVVPLADRLHVIARGAVLDQSAGRGKIRVRQPFDTNR